jgi:aldehyde dehydrogenase (NAD+)
MTTFQNFIAGAWVAPTTGAHFDNVNPADARDVIGRFPMSGPRGRGPRGRQRVAWLRGVAAHARPARGDVLRRVGDLMAARKEEIARLMTREMGKPVQETRGDVQEGIDTAYYAATRGAGSSATWCRASCGTSGR